MSQLADFLPSRSVSALSSLVELDEVVLDALPLGVYACDGDGAILRYNRKAAELWGRIPMLNDTAERFCGSHKVFSLAGERIPREATPMAKAVKEGVGCEGVRALVENPDGKRWVAMVTIAPLRDEQGALIGAINCFQDVTAAYELEQAAERDRQALEESERQHREVLQALPAAIYTTDRHGRITFFNRAAVAFSGNEPVIGSDSWCVSWKLFWPDGSPLAHEDCPMALTIKGQRPSHGEYEAVAERPDGGRAPFIPYATPLFDADGTLVGGVNMLVDISERKVAEERQRLLIDELNHRVKNTLSTVQSFAQQTARGAQEIGDFMQRFEGRLRALSNAHDRLSRRNWEGASLAEIVNEELSLHGGKERGLVAEGPDVSLPPQIALSLSMALHELGTNAVKYGALSRVGRGTVRVDWSVEEDGPGRPERVRVSWTESGGPPTETPQSRGFGSRLLQAMASELNGRAELNYPPEGLRWSLEFPAPQAARSREIPRGR